MSPSPSQALSTLRPDLGSLMEFDLERNRKNFIGYDVLPIIEVENAAGDFGRIPTEQLCKIPPVNRTSDGGYNRGGFTFTKDSYATDEYGFEMPVDERNAKLYRHYIDAEMAAAMLALNIVLSNAEMRVAAAIFDTSRWTGGSLTTGVGTAWSNAATADPIADVRAASQKVRDNCGQYATTVIFSRKVFRAVQDCDSVIERINSQGAGSPSKPSDITKEMLARVFDVDQVMVADSSYDSAAEGVGTTFTDIWSSSMAMVGIVNKAGDPIEKPGLGRTFHWAIDGSRPGGTIEHYDEPSVRGRVIRVRHETQEKPIYTEAGHLLTGIM